MSQDKLESWGELIKELNEAKRLKEEADRVKRQADLTRKMLLEKIARLNQDRLERVRYIIKEKKLKICLLHSKIFTSLPFNKSLQPEDDVVTVLMHGSWTTSYGIGDSDRTTDHHHNRYHTTACSLCRDVVGKGSFTSQPGWVENTMAMNQPDNLPPCESLYKVDILDTFSLLFGMAKVTEEDLAIK